MLVVKWRIFSMRKQVEVLFHFAKTAVIATLLYTPFNCLYIVLLIAFVSYLRIALLLSFLAQVNSTRTVTVITGFYSKSSSACPSSAAITTTASFLSLNYHYSFVLLLDRFIVDRQFSEGQ